MRVFMTAVYDPDGSQISDYFYCQEYHVCDWNISICKYNTTT